MKQLFNDYYNKEKDIKNYNGVEYVAYDKEYTDEALDNDEYDKKNDEIDLIEKHLISILMYIHMMNQNHYKLIEEVLLTMMTH
jgi:phosphoribosyl 1,2-cyclic phosphodiesterase